MKVIRVVLPYVPQEIRAHLRQFDKRTLTNKGLLLGKKLAKILMLLIIILLSVLLLVQGYFLVLPYIEQFYSEFSKEECIARIPTVVHTLMYDRYCHWLIPSLIFVPYMTHHVIWKYCLWFIETETSDESFEDPSFIERPYEHTKQEAFLQFDFDILAVILLFWIQQQLYVIYLEERIFKPLTEEFFNKPLQKYSSLGDQTWGSWKDYDRHSTIYLWWYKLYRTIYSHVEVHHGMLTAGTFFNYEPYWDLGTAWVVPARGYSHPKLLKYHWCPDDIWLTLVCHRVLFARQVSPHGGVWWYWDELFDWNWGEEIYTPGCVERGWQPLFALHHQSAFYSGYGAKKFSIPCVL